VTHLRCLLPYIFIISDLIFLNPPPARADSSTTLPNRTAEVGSKIEILDPIDCIQTFCGCSAEAELIYTTTINDESGYALQGIELRCDLESDPIVVSDKDGNASFTIVTSRNQCGYYRCRHLIFSDTGRLFDELNTTAEQTNHKVTVLHRREDPDLDSAPQ
jgi:hypothetical protein